MARSAVFFGAVLLLAGLAVVEAQRPTPWKAEQNLVDKKSTLYVTPNIMSGLLFLVLFLIIFGTGLTCLLGVQTPATFGDERNPIKALVINKQY